jgi:transcriptional regulator with GAF, ATPase, and Fis domain
MDFAGGRYRLDRKVGEGGGGEVWLARDGLRPGLVVALKRMPLAGRVDLVRFLRGEFQVLSTLEHPRLARVHDLGRFIDEGGQESLYFTREFVRGSPLEISASGMASGAALGIVLEIARALRPLHRSGLVHGDLKPGNVIVDDCGEVRLIDFALAGTLEQGAESLPTGTLRYMSPEMIEGRVPDGRGDLYALGVLLVELVTGRPPFEGGAGALMRGHLEGRVELPGGWKLPAGSRPGRKTLESLVSRLSAREPSDRFPTLDEAEAALMRALPGAGEDPHVRRAPVGGVHARSRERDRVSAFVERFGSSPETGAATVLVLGARGCGRTSFLRALRWELQMRGTLTVDLDLSRDRGPEAQVGSLLAQLVWLGRSAGMDVDPELEKLVRDGPLTPHRRLESHVGALAAALLRSGPIAVLVDDVERAAAWTCRMLRVLGGTAAERGVCFILTARVGEEARVPVLGDGPREEIVLSGLTDEDLSSMVRLVVGREDRRLVGRLREVTGGNPALASHFLERAAREGPRLDGVEREPLPERLARAWRSRLESLDGGARELMEALSVHEGPASRSWLSKLLEPRDIGPIVEHLVADGLLEVRADGGLAPAASALSSALSERLGSGDRAALHARWADVLDRTGAPEHLVLMHRAMSGRSADVADPAVEATKRLRSLGELPAAAALLGAVDEALGGRGARGARVRVALAGVLREMGRSDESVSLLETLEGKDAAVRLSLARSLVGVGRREEAVAMLEGLSREGAEGTEAADARRELALQLVHTGRLEDALAVADEALEGLEPVDEAGRADLLCNRSLALLYRERLDEAASDASEALRLARQIHDGRLRTRAHWILAMIHQRRGDLYEAAASYRQAIDICTRTDDTGNMATLLLNLGTLLHRMGEVDEAVDRYLGTMDYAWASGRIDDAILARINLGLLLARLGLFERALLEAERASEEAERIGEQDLVARATGLVAEASWRSGDLEGAARKWRSSLAMHEQAAAEWEAAEVRLDLATVLVGMEADDVDEAAALVDAASAFLEGTSSPLLEVKLALARAGIALARGQNERTLELSRTALSATRRISPEWDDYSWQGFWLMARAHGAMGSDLLYARTLRRAGESLEEASLRVPARFADAFAASPLRRRILDDLAAVESRQAPPTEQVDGRPEGEAGWRDTLMRLLDINRRLATTRDPEALVDVILDSAVEFTGAERGLLLMGAGDGELGIASARDFYEGSVPEEHMEFSTSIARKVQASGEPVITVSAMEDERFDKARSVHELKLQSILCLPIKGRRTILGVLYLENRLRSGKFSERDRDLLAAFSDQLAITMETARLLVQSREQRAELERLTEERARMLERRTQELDEARRDLKQAKSRLAGKSVFRGLVASTAEMRRIFSLIERVGESDVPVVITGESGTGKEMVARAVHAGEARRRGPFVAVNCGAVPGELLESELFGHVRGAFTGAVRDKKGVFAMASSGTLLLDEVGDMPTKMQLDLLRVLQEGTVRPVGSDSEQSVDVRVLAASQRPLDELVRDGLFREDLYYRLRVVEVRIPPLRDRRDDIPLLIDHFLAAFSLRFDTERKAVSRRAVRMLMEHPWPGNVRQLEHALLNAWVLSDSRVLDAHDFETVASQAHEPAGRGPEEPAASSIEDEERRSILDALKAARWNKTEAAKRLGIPRRTFYRRLRKFGLLK